MHIGFDLSQVTTFSWACSVPLTVALIGAAFTAYRSSRRKNGGDDNSGSGA
jgi:hypothetical protein